MTAAFAPTPGPAPEDLGGNLGERLARLTPRLLRVALRYTRDADASADVVQSAIEKAVRHHSQFRGRSQFSTWIHRIVVNEALMWLRSNQRLARRSVAFDQIEAAAIPDTSPSALARILDDERDRHVRNALTRLSPDEQELLERCAMNGEGYQQYGAERGLGAAAVKSRAYRARRRLESLLDDPNGGNGGFADATDS